MEGDETEVRRITRHPRREEAHPLNTLALELGGDRRLPRAWPQVDPGRVGDGCRGLVLLPSGQPLQGLEMVLLLLKGESCIVVYQSSRNRSSMRHPVAMLIF